MALFPVDTFTSDQLEPIYPVTPLARAVSLSDGTYTRGTVLGRSTATPANEVQSIAITGTPTGGTFTLSFTNPITGAVEATGTLPYNATAATVQAWLLVLGSFEPGDLVATGGPFPDSAVTVTFGGRYGNRPVPNLGASANFTGGTAPAIAVTETTPGVVVVGTCKAYATGNGDGSGTAIGVLQTGCRVALGRLFLVGSQGESMESAVAFLTGTYRTTQLVGLDADALTDLGARLLEGTVADGIVHIP